MNRFARAVALLAIVAAPATLAMAQSVPVNGEPHPTNSDDALTGINSGAPAANGTASGGSGTGNADDDAAANTTSAVPRTPDPRLGTRLNPRINGR